MHNQKILLRGSELAPVQDINPLEPVIFQRIGEPLPLNPGHVEHVQLGHGGLQVCNFYKFQALFLHKFHHIRRNRQISGGNQVEPNPREHGKGLDEGMHRAPILEVAAKSHIQVTDFAPKGGNGGEVGQGLGGVHMPAVACVDHRHVGVQAGGLGSALGGGAHDDHIRIVRHHFNGILQGLALGGGRGLGVRKAEYAAPQPHHRRLEAEIRPSRRLKKKARHHITMQRIHKILGMSNDLTGQPIQLVPFLQREVFNVDQIPEFHPDVLLISFYFGLFYHISGKSTTPGA